MLNHFTVSFLVCRFRISGAYKDTTHDNVCYEIVEEIGGCHLKHMKRIRTKNPYKSENRIIQLL